MSKKHWKDYGTMSLLLTLHFYLQPDVEVVQREHTGHMITWTGPGFARVRDGVGLSFHIDNIPYPMEYGILFRYEPEVGRNCWREDGWDFDGQSPDLTVSSAHAWEQE